MKKTAFLLVDENAIALRELTDILKYIGCKDIQQASNANDAWALMRVKPFGCVITAWDMPDMSGLALLRVVRGDDKFFDLPFFLTDSAFTKIKVVQAGQAGVTGLIVCPFEIENIKQKIHAMSGPTPVEEDTSQAEAALEEGLKLLDDNDYEKALDVFEKMTEQGEDAEYYYNIGYVKTAEAKYDEAIKAFRKATQLDRLFAKAFEAMGRVYNQMGQSAEAQRYLQKAADIYMSKENVDDAEQILNELLEINPDTINVYNSLGVLYRKKGDLNKSLKYYFKALKVHPDEPNIYYNIGRLYLELQNPNEAKKNFAKALNINPGFKEAKDVLEAIQLGSL